jgi:hypothetical protein
MNLPSEFSTEVIAELKYYVYRLIDPRNGETFYVGKGKGNRVFQHMKGALAGDDADEVNDKLQTIREIHNAGLDVIHVIHRHGMDEENAFEVEASLIDAYPCVTNIQGGTGSNDFGPMNAKEIIDKYAAEEAVFHHKCLMITINRTASERGIYSATRYAWKISKTKVKEVGNGNLNYPGCGKQNSPTRMKKKSSSYKVVDTTPTTRMNSNDTYECISNYTETQEAGHGNSGNQPPAGNSP